MEFESKFGRMGLSMKGSGEMIKLRGMGDRYMNKVTYMRVFIKKVKLKERECIHIQMEPRILVSGKKIDSMDKEKKHGQMEQFTQVSMCMEKNKEKDYLIGQMDLLMMEISLGTIFMVTESINGQMGENTQEDGK